MNENVMPATGSEAVSPAVPSLEVRVYPVTKKDNLLAYASVNLDGVFAVNGLRLVDGEKGPFVSMPSKPDGRGGYRDICFPITAEMRQALNDAVLGEYQRTIEKMSERSEQVTEKVSVRGALQGAAKEAAARPAPTAARAADKGAR